MHDLIEIIRAAIAADATTEKKAAGVQACRTIAAALGTEPGKPLVLPGMSPPTTTSRVSVDQVLDLMIARLATIASERDKAPPAPKRAPAGLRVPRSVVPHAARLAKPVPKKP